MTFLLEIIYTRFFIQGTTTIQTRCKTIFANKKGELHGMEISQVHQDSAGHQSQHRQGRLFERFRRHTRRPSHDGQERHDRISRNPRHRFFLRQTARQARRTKYHRMPILRSPHEKTMECLPRVSAALDPASTPAYGGQHRTEFSC